MILTVEAPKKQTAKLASAKFQKDVFSSIFILRMKRQRHVDPDEAAFYEPPHLDLSRLQIQIFSFLALLTHCILIDFSTVIIPPAFMPRGIKLSP